MNVPLRIRGALLALLLGLLVLGTMAVLLAPSSWQYLLLAIDTVLALLITATGFGYYRRKAQQPHVEEWSPPEVSASEHRPRGRRLFSVETLVPETARRVFGPDPFLEPDQTDEQLLDEAVAYTKWLQESGRNDNKDSRARWALYSIWLQKTGREDSRVARLVWERIHCRGEGEVDRSMP